VITRDPCGVDEAQVARKAPGDQRVEADSDAEVPHLRACDRWVSKASITVLSSEGTATCGNRCLQ